MPPAFKFTVMINIGATHVDKCKPDVAIMPYAFIWNKR